MNDWVYEDERTLPKGVHGPWHFWPKPDLDNRPGDITGTQVDGTQRIIKSKDLPQIIYDKKKGKKDGSTNDAV